MRAHVPPAEVENVLETLHDHQRLTGLVTALAHEVARLDEDNLQLHAAVKMYREVLRRYHVGAEGSVVPLAHEQRSSGRAPADASR